MEDSYFRPFGQRTMSNQALYSADGVVVIYTRLGSPNIMKYVSNRAAWLGRQDLMITPRPSSSALSDDDLPIIERREGSSNSSPQCTSEEPHMRSCQTTEQEDPGYPRPRAAKVAIADKEHFKSELTNCGFSLEGKKHLLKGKYTFITAWRWRSCFSRNDFLK